MARPNVNFRDVVRGVRLNFSLVVVLLVTLSVLSLGLVLLVVNDERISVSQASIDRILVEYPRIRDYVQEEDLNLEIISIANILRAEFQESTRQFLLIFTPAFVLLSGVVAFIVARYLVRPIHESYNAQERFLQDAAHELRNPLAAMKVTVQSTKNNPNLSQDDISSLLNSMERQVNQMIRINENLMILDQAKRPGQAANVNISELLYDVIEDLQSLANKKNITIRHQVDENIEFPISAGEFVRVMRNVIENAIKYSTEDSDEVRVALRKKGNKIRISVRDFGIGIPEEDLHQIGNRFYRAANTSAFEGTGLGMAIVQKTVRAYGGTLTIKSSVGDGTHVVINF